MAPLSLALTALPIVLPSGCLSLSPVTLCTQAGSHSLFTVPQPSVPFHTLTFLFMLFLFPGMHACTCLVEQLLPVHPG